MADSRRRIRLTRRLVAALIALVLVGVVVFILSRDGKRPSAAVSTNGGARAQQTSSSSAPPQTVNQALLHQCEASQSNCEATVPGLAACVAAQSVCDYSAQQQVENSRIASETGPMTEASAISRALQGIPPPYPPTYAKETTLSQYNSVSGESLTDPESSSDQVNVWVVSVNTPVETDGSPFSPPRGFDWETFVYDAQTGLPLERCIGCSILSPTSNNAAERHS